MFGWFREWLERRKKAVMFEAAILVKDEAGTIVASYPDGVSQSVTWQGLERIEVHTNDTGPWGADVWWVLSDGNGTCSYPQGATGDADMISKYQALPGFDDRELVKAMGCTDNRVFVCWQRPSAPVS